MRILPISSACETTLFFNQKKVNFSHCSARVAEGLDDRGNFFAHHSVERLHSFAELCQAGFTAKYKSGG